MSPPLFLMQYSQLVDYIRTMRARRYSDAQLRASIAKLGWSAEIIQKAFNDVSQPPQPSVPVPMTPVEVTPVEAQPVEVTPVSTVPAQQIPPSRVWEGTVVTGAPQPQPTVVPVMSWQQYAAKDYEKLGIVERSRMIIVKPHEFFSNIPSQGLGTSFTHYAIMMALTALISIAFGLASGGNASLTGSLPLEQQEMLQGVLALGMTALVFGVAIGGFIFSIIFAPISAGIAHLFFKLVGGKANYSGTLKTVFYISTIAPFLQIPIIGPLIGLYGIWVTFVAYSTTHKIGLIRTLIALLLPFILLLIIVVIIGVVFFMSIISSFLAMSGAMGGTPLNLLSGGATGLENFSIPVD